MKNLSIHWWFPWNIFFFLFFPSRSPLFQFHFESLKNFFWIQQLCDSKLKTCGVICAVRYSSMCSFNSLTSWWIYLARDGNVSKKIISKIFWVEKNRLLRKFIQSISHTKHKINQTYLAPCLQSTFSIIMRKYKIVSRVALLFIIEGENWKISMEVFSIVQIVAPLVH